jgi:aminopeptidase N
VDDLRQSFEEMTGRDLHWFFDQWYFSEGHPVLDVSHAYEAGQRKLNIVIEQTQIEEGFREVFTLPLEVAIFHQDSSIEIQRVQLDRKSQTFSFDLSAAPLAVVIDPRDIMLAVVNHDISSSEYPIRVLSGNLSINHRLSAYRLMEELEPEVLNKLMMDTSYTMRAMVISYLGEKEEVEKLYQLSLRDNDPEMQFYILESIAQLDKWKAREIALRLLDSTDRVPIIYSSLKAIAAVDIDEAIHRIAHYQDNPSPAIYAVQASIYAQKGSVVELGYFTSEKASKISEDYLEEFIGAMALYMSGQPAAVQDEGLKMIDSDFYIRSVSDWQYRRFYLITGLLKQYAAEEENVYQAKLLKTINSLYSKETNEYLRGVLKEGLGDLLD